MNIVVMDPWGFTPPYDRELCKGLASIGHEVTIITQDRSDSDIVGDVETAGFRVLGLFSAPPAWVPRPLALLFKGVRHVQGMLRSFHFVHRQQPDIIHVQWLPLPVIDALFILLFRRIAAVVLTIHDSNPYNGAGPWLLRFGNMLAIRRFDRWIVHNELSIRQLTDHGLPAERMHQVAHGLLSQPNVSTEDGADDGDDHIHFLQFGKIKDYKGVDIFLAALGRLSEVERKRCRVSIIGRPYIDTEPLFDLVERLRLQPLVDLKFDFVSDAEMASLFDTSDFLVFPYRGIDTSGVLMAAVARGIPVIASDIGCFSEMLTDGKEGKLVPPEDPNALAAVLSDIINDPAKAKSMRIGMKALQQRIPSWSSIAETTTQIYELAQALPVSKPIRVHP